MTRERIAVLRKAGLAAALLAAVGIIGPAQAGKADNSVRFAYDQTIDNIDPYFSLLTITSMIADNVWDTLIFRDPKTGAYQGNLATAWRWVDDKILELDLRQGVTFHNGETFDADDVVYTLNFVARPESRAVNVGLIRWIDHVEKVTAYRVRIVTKQPFPAAVAFLASPYSVIHPIEHYAKAGPRGVNERPVGTGPFRVVEYVRGKSIRLERNRDYFKGGPKSEPRIDRVDVRFVPDAQTRVAEAVAGGVDLIMGVAPDQAQQLRDLSALRVMAGGTMRYDWLRMNTLAGSPAPQLRDVRVRRAINHAIDREAIAKFIAGEDARVVHAACHPNQFGCDDASVTRYKYDPAKARVLLAEAGFPNGFDIDLYAYRDRNQIEAIIGYLQAVGIRARLRFMQVAALSSATRAGKVALRHYSWGSQGIDDVSASVSYYHEFSLDDMNRDAEVRDLLVRGDSSMDPEVRKQSYSMALRLIAERAYAVPLYAPPNHYVAAKELMFDPDPDEIPRFYEMSWK